MSKRGIVFLILVILVISSISFVAAQQTSQDSDAQTKEMQEAFYRRTQCTLSIQYFEVDKGSKQPCCDEFPNLEACFCKKPENKEDPKCTQDKIIGTGGRVNGEETSTVNSIKNFLKDLGGTVAGKLEAFLRLRAVFKAKTELECLALSAEWTGTNCKLTKEEAKQRGRDIVTPPEGKETKPPAVTDLKQTSKGTATMVISGSGTPASFDVACESSLTSESCNGYINYPIGPGCESGAAINFDIEINYLSLGNNVKIICARVENRGKNSETYCLRQKVNCITNTGRAFGGSGSGSLTTQTCLPGPGDKNQPGGCFLQAPVEAKWELTGLKGGGSEEDQQVIGGVGQTGKEGEEDKELKPLKFVPVQSIIGTIGNGLNKIVDSVGIGGGGKVIIDETPTSDETGQCKADWSCSAWAPSDSECRGGTQKRSCTCACTNGKCSGNRANTKFCSNSASGYRIPGPEGVSYNLNVNGDQISLIDSDGISQGGLGIHSGENTKLTVNNYGSGKYEVSLNLPNGKIGSNFVQSPDGSKNVIAINSPEGALPEQLEGKLTIKKDGKQIGELPFIIDVEQSKGELLEEVKGKFSLARFLLILVIIVPILYFLFLLFKRFKDKEEEKGKKSKEN